MISALLKPPTNESRKSSPGGNLQSDGEQGVIELNRDRFNEQFQRFKSLIPIHNKGHAFTNFHEGEVAVWEGCKPHLRDHALGILVPDAWTETQIRVNKIGE